MRPTVLPCLTKTCQLLKKKLRRPCRCKCPYLEKLSGRIGFKNRVIDNRNWRLLPIGTAEAATRVFFCFSLGMLATFNLFAKSDCVNDLIASPWHIAAIQGVEATPVQETLFDSRGIQSVVSRDRCIMINAGGSGPNMARKPIRMMMKQMELWLDPSPI